MTIQGFSKGEALRFGWNIAKTNCKFFISLLMLMGLVYFATQFIVVWTDETFPIISVFISLVSSVLYVVMQMGLIQISLKLYDNEEVKLSNLFSCFPLFLKYLFSSIIYGLLMIVGTIFLIIPGIILAIKLQFFSYSIVDKGLGPIQALEKSWQITKGVKWNLFLFGLLLMLINLVGMLCLLIGLFVTVPITMMAVVFVYRKLLDQVEMDVSPGIE
ncbi:MAG: hypothetical protein AAB110_00885 [Candidatus Desantisbacteria bacterium]